MTTDTKTDFSLVEGRVYKLSLFGVTRLSDNPSHVTDGVCTFSTESGAWQHSPTAGAAPAVLVDGRRVFGDACKGGRHLYQVRWTARRTAPLHVQLTGGVPDLHEGHLTLAVARPGFDTTSHLAHAPVTAAAPTDPAVLDGTGSLVRSSFEMPAEQNAAVSAAQLQAGVSYVVTVIGVQRIAPELYSDGFCSAWHGHWYRQVSMNPFDPGADHGQLYFEGRPLAGTAPAEDPTGCSTHQHQVEITPTHDGLLQLALWDPDGADDNHGSLSVEVDRVSPVPLPPPAPVEAPRATHSWYARDERLTYTPASGPAVSSLRFRRGEHLHLAISGTSGDGGQVRSDATCVASDGGWAASLGLSNGQDVLEVLVNGAAVSWHATDGARCSEAHAYVADVVARQSGRLRFELLDADTADDPGSFDISVHRVR